MLRIAKRKGDKVRFAELLKVNVEAGEEGEEEEEGDDLGDLTPPFPVLQMNNDQINQYFPKLIKKMLDMEAGQGKRGRLWASSTEPAGKEKYTFLVDIDYICVISQGRSVCTTRLLSRYRPIQVVPLFFHSTHPQHVLAFTWKFYDD